MGFESKLLLNVEFSRRSNLISHSSSPGVLSNRPISLAAIVLLALAVHGPLLLMQLPSGSYDANTHMFFAQHYAENWFNPWNEKWFAGFSQTTYPPLTHQWIALFSHVMGLKMAYMFVQLVSLLLLPIGMFRFARLWVDDRSASLAAVGTVFLGSLAMLVYQSGQINTTMAAALVLNALPYFYGWCRRGNMNGLINGLILMLTAAASHHVTVIFGVPLFVLPVMVLAWLDRENSTQGEEPASTAGVISRAAVFAALAAVGVGVVLFPYWIQLLQNPISQLPIPHGSRDNYLLNTFSGMNFWIIPMGALLLALPFIFWKGLEERRLRPLFFGFYLTMLIGLGGTTPVAQLLLRRAFQVLTFERFTFWATLMCLPIVGLLCARLIDRYAMKAIAALTVAAVFTFSMAVAWMTFHPINTAPFNVNNVVNFLNRDGHNKFRYLTLGFGAQFSQVSTLSDASTVDGDYNSARLLPELTQYGSARLDNAKYYGTAGMESLRAMLKHANQYGLKYIFVRDRYYEPLLAFAGWRQVEAYENGNVTLWSKEDIVAAQPVHSSGMPTRLQSIAWGTLPMGCSLLAIALVLLWPERRRVADTMEFRPTAAPSPVTLREAK